MSQKRYSTKYNTKSNPQKKVYTIRNWKQYNKALINRGDVTFWISKESITLWLFQGKHKKGAPQTYSNVAITTALIFRSLYSLPLRATQGFVRYTLKTLKLKLPTPDYSTISRRQKKLLDKFDTILKRTISSKEPLHVVIDSTGLKVYGEGEWKVRRYGFTKRRTWRKLHFAIDSKGNIISEMLTTNSIADSNAGEQLLNTIPAEANIETIKGDAGYDTKNFYKACTKRNARAIIRPQTNARIRPEPEFADRNKAIHDIHAMGSKTWRLASGYSSRALVENTVFRYKTIFGDKPQARSFENQRTEAAVKCWLLNKFYELGRPHSVRVA